MQKKIQISYELFLQIFRFFILEDESEMTRKQITDGLGKKVRSLYEHELYSRSKTALTDEERESARRKYLDEKGIPEDFRW